MMPFVVGEDTETQEIIVGDTRRNVFFLRGPMSEQNAIHEFVQAANERIHNEPVKQSSMQACIASQIEAGGFPRVD